MGISRRSLLQAGGLGTLALPLAANAMESRDRQASVWDGPGIYLYPAWGRPQPYLVLPAAEGRSLLEFRDPATTELLWTQSPALHAEFAGKVIPL